VVPGRPGTLPGVADTWHELWDRVDGLPAPIAASLPDCAAVLRVELAAVEAAARHVAPYQHADGSPRWSVAEVADRLGLVDRDGKGHRLSRRTGDGDEGRARRHAQRGAAATNGRRAADRAAAELAAAPEPEPVEDLAELVDLDGPAGEDLAAEQ
jgi:phage protein D